MSTTSEITKLIASPETTNLCLLLAKAFSSPQHYESHFPQSVREMTSRLPAELAASGLVMANEWERVEEDSEAVLLAYSRLFIGPFEIQAPAYASHYLEPDQRLMGEVSMWVADFYTDSDLGPTEEPSDVPDHIALEWEFLYYLGHQSITHDEPDWSIRAQTFIDAHMKEWLPQFSEAILAAETHSFYHALARFAPLFLQFISAEEAKGNCGV